MRVIAGVAGGRRLVAPEGREVRPTSDRVKEAWFSSLQPRLAGAVVVDLFAGSGALGIEAASRGAGRVVAVEHDGAALAILRENVRLTGLDVQVVPGDVTRVVPDDLPRPLDVVLMDPPYDLDDEVLAEVLAGVGALLAAGGEVWLERARRRGAPPWPATLLADRVRRYGDVTLHRAVHQPSAEDPS